MKNILIYGRLSCPFTQLALRHAKQKKVFYEFIDISNISPAHKKQLKKKNHVTVPAVFVKCGKARYRFIGGSEHFLAFLKNNF